MNDVLAVLLTLICLIAVSAVITRWRRWHERSVGPDTLSAFLARQIVFSRQTFGPGRRTLGITRHMEKEIAEVREDPDDLSEWVDLVILALDGYWRHGGTPATILRDLQAKLDRNIARTWPPTAPESEPVEHVR
jgi:hypothetical protein